MARKIHQVGTVFPVVDGEGRIDADLLGVIPQQACADAMECAAPGKRIGGDAGIRTQHLATDPLDAAAHLGGGAARKGHQQNAAWVRTLDDQMRDAMGKRIRLAGAGPGNHKQRPGDMTVACSRAVLHCQPLLRVQLFQIGGGHELS
ncbi:hypothetical protein RHSP_71330 [Rhizobium freirei PRF 81]|uniref:Uncharacterized protein n=1 Tax=Rhizobium freirei PRF 81 TaxID=363754 RepID=N6UTC4_9HYPH|nr:hypothetical protein RHSP_71330 [Rhizobium freirei PRF 81]